MQKALHFEERCLYTRIYVYVYIYIYAIYMQNINKLSNMKTLTHPPSIRFVHFGKALNDVYIVLSQED